MHRALGIEHRESGLAARLLLTCPPRKAKRWTEADIDPATEAAIAGLLDRLTHRCHIFEMNSESFRFRESMKSKKGKKASEGA